MHLIQLTSLASMLLFSQAVFAHEAPKGHSPSQVASSSRRKAKSQRNLPCTPDRKCEAL